jgi:hypothetical protein
MSIEATTTDPLAQGDIDMYAVIRDKIHDLVCTVAVLPASRERSTIMTKLDEARHWLGDAEAFSKAD